MLLSSKVLDWLAYSTGNNKLLVESANVSMVAASLLYYKHIFGIAYCCGCKASSNRIDGWSSLAPLSIKFLSYFFMCFIVLSFEKNYVSKKKFASFVFVIRQHRKIVF